ncbi:MAG: DNA polymerase V [Gammaproteobacteria bacterium CG22_combo_CG10-13_8_21_14_all_40_8]|nr:MAG: DNA polymerase V [Gammaproteobacteria bacterium CG22_combo_CG10-13_8_21_14_all_40_8]
MLCYTKHLPKWHSLPLLLPYFDASVSAGFPSPADDYIDRFLDLNELLIEHPSSTYLARAQGSSMIEVGIHDGDILIVDRAIEARNGDAVIVALDGELTCKLLDLDNRCLKPANSQYAIIPISELADFIIEGVIISSIRCHRPINHSS